MCVYKMNVRALGEGATRHDNEGKKVHESKKFCWIFFMEFIQAFVRSLHLAVTKKKSMYAIGETKWS